MKNLLYVCEVNSGGIAEYAIRQSAALTSQGFEVHFLCRERFPSQRLAAGINVEILKSGKADTLVNVRGLVGRILRTLQMICELRSQSKQVLELATKLAQTSSTRHRPGTAEFAVLFACYKEYFAPFWVGPLRRLAKQGVVIGTIAHDPVRDFVVGPLWWHKLSVRLGYSFVRHVFVHDDTPVDFLGGQPEGIEVHQIPHGPYEVAEPKIGRLEMRQQLGFLTTDDSDIHGCFQKAQGHAQETCAGASEPDSLVSELSDSSVSESLTCSADGSAGAHIAPTDPISQIGDRGIGSVGVDQFADSSGFLEGQSQAGLQMDSQKHQSIRVANNPGASRANSSLVSISVIGGKKTSGAPEVHSPATSHSPLATPASPDVVFLAFGQIRDGKNLDLFLRAMTQLPENVKLLVAGKGDSGSSRPPEFYQNLAEELGVADRCRWDIRRIPDEEVGNIFSACDAVVVTYSAKFRSASGVLNAAVSARKLVLASSGSGPLKTVVNKYNLGVFVEPDNLKEVFRGAKQLLDLFSAPANQNLDARHSNVDTAQPLARSCFLNPDWVRYEKENSWAQNAQTVSKTLE